MTNIENKEVRCPCFLVFAGSRGIVAHSDISGMGALKDVISVFNTRY